jgi:uroporphyrinogen decarboxylase
MLIYQKIWKYSLGVAYKEGIMSTNPKVKELESKSRLINLIKNKKADRIGLMFRSHANMNDILLKQLLDTQPETRNGLAMIQYNSKLFFNNYKKILDSLGADNYSSGYNLSSVFNFFPKYVGPRLNTGNGNDYLYWYTWGIDNKIAIISGFDSVLYGLKPPLTNCESIDDINKYNFPEISWFDFENYYYFAMGPDFNYIETKDIKKEADLKNNFFCTGVNNSIFTISSYMRGVQKFLEDLAFNKSFAKAIIDKVGEFCFEFNKVLISKLGNSIEIYGIWDDFAMQNGMIISPKIWRELLKPWYKKIIEEAKKNNLMVLFHCCGSYHDVVPDLIDLGIDILDPVQTMAKEWDLYTLKKKYGNNLCFHGGVDMEKLLTWSPGKIYEESKKLNKLFKEGGLILGPSSEITPDVPLENIKAIYGFFK